MRNATLSECSMGGVFPMRTRLEYIPLSTDPARRVCVSELHVRDKREEETPAMDFVMGLSQYMRMVCGAAAILLTALMAVNM